jgi:hypothetical protein
MSALKVSRYFNRSNNSKNEQLRDSSPVLRTLLRTVIVESLLDLNALGLWLKRSGREAEYLCLWRVSMYGIQVYTYMNSHSGGYLCF